MDAVSSALASRQEIAQNALKQAATQDRTAVALVDQAVAESKATPTGTVTPTRGSNLNIVV
ncbi:MAG: hypothetical protein R3F55_10215 [Alphaproteobacteria bacterium]